MFMGTLKTFLFYLILSPPPLITVPVNVIRNVCNCARYKSQSEKSCGKMANCTQQASDS